MQELESWQTELKDWNGKSVIPQKHQHILTTDASHLGWGATDILIPVTKSLAKIPRSSES